MKSPDSDFLNRQDEMAKEGDSIGIIGEAFVLH
jgi:hypothetical protein